MPYRKVPFIPGEMYHIFNRSVARQPIFVTDYDYQRAIDVLEFYSYEKPQMRYSHYRRLPLVQKKELLKSMSANRQKLVQVLCFCLMPNHFHLLIREISENGISRYMRYFQNSYAKYFNVKNDRAGALFQEMFKAIHIETDEQLIHVARYIHLNPLTSYIVRDFEDLDNYRWSSYNVYTGQTKSDFIDTQTILAFFRFPEKYIEFLKDQIDYQRQLENIKHLLLDR